MKQNYLFPHRYKMIGWCMFLPFMAVYIGSLTEVSIFSKDLISCKVFAILSNGSWLQFIENEITNEISIIGLVVSLIFISCSSEKDEDEYIEKIRLQSLMHSLMISCSIFIFGTLFIYGTSYIVFSYVYIFVFLFSFVLLFNIRLIKFRKSCHE